MKDIIADCIHMFYQYIMITLCNTALCPLFAFAIALILIQVGMYSQYPDLFRVIIVFVIHRQGMYKTNLVRIKDKGDGTIFNSVGI